VIHEFDPGYAPQPWRTLCESHPGEETYPPADFRTEWGPIFHRGRLDGKARVLVIGQDPAEHEAIARRILTGEAGQRVQGFLAKLGIERSYVMINTFLYGVYGQRGGERHRDDDAIVAYRNRWLDALFAAGTIEAVVALGALAERAWDAWKATPAGQAVTVAFRRVTHPTQPESASNGDPEKRDRAIATMLRNWNDALATLHPAIVDRDVERALVPYGSAFAADDLVEIPERDLPAGLPRWMRALERWASREGNGLALKRATIRVRVPSRFRP
jgi:uracil-DNA glycosylase